MQYRHLRYIHPALFPVLQFRAAPLLPAQQSIPAAKWVLVFPRDQLLLPAVHPQQEYLLVRHQWAPEYFPAQVLPAEHPVPALLADLLQLLRCCYRFLSPLAVPEVLSPTDPAAIRYQLTYCRPVRLLLLPQALPG